MAIATERLQLPRAARRIFLENGDEIKDESQFLKNSSVYVSLGEDYQDPYVKTKEIIDRRKVVIWKSDGLHFLDSETANNNNNLNENRRFSIKSTSTTTAKTTTTKRLVAFENGSEFNPTLVFLEQINPAIKNVGLSYDDSQKMERDFLNDFLEQCAQRMKMHGMPRCVYTWTGNQVFSIEDVPKLEKCLQKFLMNNEVEHAPVWISKGECFIARNALAFLDHFIRNARLFMKEQAQKRDKLTRNLNAVERESFQQSKSSTQIRILELRDNIDRINNDLDELSKALQNLEVVKSDLVNLNEEQTNNGYTSLFKHIKNVNTNEKIFGGLASKGIKLKVFINGTDDWFKVFFNTKSWFSDDKIVQKNNFQSLMEEINRVYSKKNASANSNANLIAKFTRLFNETGEEEIDTVTRLSNNDQVWVTQGEIWRGGKDVPMAMSLKLSMLFVVKNNNNNNTENTSADLANQFRNENLR